MLMYDEWLSSMLEKKKTPRQERFVEEYRITMPNFPTPSANTCSPDCLWVPNG
jgi:hypothetical protein